jgi:hypothetical protein
VQNTGGYALKVVGTLDVDRLNINGGSVAYHSPNDCKVSYGSTSAKMSCYSGYPFIELIDDSYTTTLSDRLTIKSVDIVNASQQIVAVINGSTATFSGNVTANDFIKSSDINLKSNLVIIQDSLLIINNISGYRFTWNEKSQNNGLKDVGVIAQEVEKYIPEAVYGEEGDKKVSYDKLIPVLIEAIKELSNKVNILEKRLGDK